MKRTMIVMMEVVVEDLSTQARRDCADIEGCKTRDLPRLKDVEAYEIADLLLPHSGDTELFAGSGIYAEFSSSRIISAEFYEKDNAQ